MDLVARADVRGGDPFRGHALPVGREKLLKDLCHELMPRYHTEEVDEVFGVLPDVRPDHRPVARVALHVEQGQVDVAVGVRRVVQPAALQRAVGAPQVERLPHPRQVLLERAVLVPALVRLALRQPVQEQRHLRVQRGVFAPHEARRHRRQRRERGAARAPRPRAKAACAAQHGLHGGPGRGWRCCARVKVPPPPAWRQAYSPPPSGAR